eukprot:UN07484
MEATSYIKISLYLIKNQVIFGAEFSALFLYFRDLCI